MNRRFALLISQRPSGTEGVNRASQKNCMILQQVLRIKISEANSTMTTPKLSWNGSGQITLIEFILFPLYIVLVATCVRWGLHRYGWRGALGGLIFGFILLPLGAYALGILASLIYFGIPYPACRTGNCRSSNYQSRRLDNGRYALFCGCGTPYRKRGRRFYEVQPDGSLRPYMVWRAFRGWFPEGQ
jgi:hypothetical protein